jgi:hypothetical protein
MDDYQKLGWVRVYRKTLFSSVWKNPITWMVWSWILLKANHGETVFPFGGKDIILKRGQFITGRETALREIPTLTAQKYKTAIKYLKSTNRITIKTTNKFSVITINSWDDHQESNQQNKQPVTNKQPTNNQQITTNNNDKNDKNDKNNIVIEKKDLQEIADKYGVSLEEVFKTYENMLAWFEEVPARRKGRDYRATLKNWVRKNKTAVKQTTEQRIFIGIDGVRQYKYILVNGQRKEII